MSQKQINLIKLAKTAFIITKVLRILIYVSVIAMFACIATLVTLKELNGIVSGIFSGSTGDALNSLGINTIDIEIGYKEVICLILHSAVSIIIISMILLFLGTIFKSIINGGSPFELSNVKCLKKVAISIALLSVIPTLIETLLGAILRTSDIIRFQVDVGYIVLAFFFFCLAYVFEYGTELQKQSDETL